METLKAIKTRKSTRALLNKEIPEEVIMTLMEAGMAAPSAVDRRPWEFYVVKSEENKKKIIDAMPFGKYQSSIIIIPCIKEIRTIPTKRDLACCDLAAATENILLAATDLGLGSVWCAVHPDKSRIKAVKKALDLPMGITPFSAIYVGYIDEANDKGKIKDKFDRELVHII